MYERVPPFVGTEGFRKGLYTILDRGDFRGFADFWGGSALNSERARDSRSDSVTTHWPSFGAGSGDPAPVGHGLAALYAVGVHATALGASAYAVRPAHFLEPAFRCVLVGEKVEKVKDGDSVSVGASGSMLWHRCRGSVF